MICRPGLPATSSCVSRSHLPRLQHFAALLLIPAFTTSVFAQQQPYYPGAQQPYSLGYQYDPGQQYQHPYGQPQADYGQPEPGYDQQADYGQSQPLGPDQLDQLVAPIALNPDPLVALMLAASTYPAQVQDADQWREAQGDAPPDQIAYGANLQAWDPSVKALTAFPQVLAEMDRNIQWTAALGTAYYNQPQDVLQAVQFMRQRAQAAGNLQSTPQQSVEYDDGNIQLMPVNPQVVYVPAYNPWTAYGDAVAPYPGFSLIGAIGAVVDTVGSAAIQFGVGTVMSAFVSAPWGLLSWGLDWLGQSLLFNHSDYFSNSGDMPDWGFRYGGPRAWMRPHREDAAYGRGYGRGFDRGYGRDFNRGYGRDFNRGYGRGGNGGYNRGNNGRGFGGSESFVRRSYGDSFRNQQGFRAGQSFNGRGSYGSGYGANYRTGIYNRGQSSYGGRAGYGYNRSSQGYNRGFTSGRAQQFNRRAYGTNYGSGFNGGSRRGFSQRGNAFAGRGFMGSSGRSSHSGHSGGFHLFGGNRSSRGFGGGGFKAPHYKAPKMHGGGFGGGGHHGGGGGHHFGGGGGHHGGGGGGHHGGGGGGHHGGGHHR